MADRTIKPDDTHDLVLQNNDGSSKLELNEDQTVKVTTGSDAGEDFTVNTTQLVVEGDTGKVGIGTAAPQELLHVSKSGSGFPLEVEATTGDFIGTKITNTEGSWGFYTDGGEFNVYDVGTGVERMNFDSSGNVKINSGNLVIGAAGKGIDFSNQASPASGMTSELLDSYEEGTWTAAVKGTGGGNKRLTMNHATGYYTKIGNLVTITGYFTTSNLDGGDGTASGALIIAGLPYTIANNTGAYSGGVACYGENWSMGTAGYISTYLTTIDDSYLQLYLWDGTSGPTSMQVSEWTATGQTIINCSYRVA